GGRREVAEKIDHEAVSVWSAAMIPSGVRAREHTLSRQRRQQQTVVRRVQPLEAYPECRVEPRVLEYLERAAVSHDASAVHHNDPIEEPEGEIEVVHHDNGQPSPRGPDQ